MDDKDLSNWYILEVLEKGSDPISAGEGREIVIGDGNWERLEDV